MGPGWGVGGGGGAGRVGTVLREATWRRQISGLEDFNYLESMRISQFQ